MRRILLFLGTVLCLPVVMGVGLGPGLFSGSGVLHPTGATEDSYVWLGENATNTTGTEKAGFTLPYDRELFADQLIDIHDGGFGFSKWEYAYSQDTLASNREACAWASLGHNTNQPCSAPAALHNDRDYVIPVFGTTRVEAFLVSIGVTNGMGASGDECTVRLEHNNSGANPWGNLAVPVYTEDTPGAGADPMTEVAAVQLGPGSVNTDCTYGVQGASGSMTGGVANVLEWCFTTPNYTATQGYFILTISDRETGVTDCSNAHDDLWVAVKYRYEMP